MDAMAIAAKSLGYSGAAWLIEYDRLNPAQVSRMLLSGASQDRGRIAATIILAGATWRHHHDRANWDGGEIERLLAVAALDLTSDRCLFDHCAETARRLVQNHLRSRQRKRNGRRSAGLSFDSIAPDRDSGKRGASHPAIRA